MLFLYQDIDEFVMRNLENYNKRKLISIETRDASRGTLRCAALRCSALLWRCTARACAGVEDEVEEKKEKGAKEDEATNSSDASKGLSDKETGAIGAVLCAVAR